MSTNRIIVKGADFSQVAIEQELVTRDEQVDFSWNIIGKYIVKESGELESLSTWNISNYITIPNDLISIYGQIYGYETVANIAFYDDSNVYLGGVDIQHGPNNYTLKRSDFPAGTTKIRLCSNVHDVPTFIASLNFVYPA